MLKLATILDNPGEPPTETRYRDPRELRRLGYNGLVLYETTGLSGIESPEAVGTGEMRRWVERQFEHAQETLQKARLAGLQTYVVYDTLTLARSLVEKQATHLVCRNRSTMLCPASDQALALSVRALEALLARWPQLDGVVLRFGDSDASRLPYLVGNDIYQPHCARCSQLGRAQRIGRVLTRFYERVVSRLNKRLIVRAWNVRPNGMHDSVELCSRLRDMLPAADQPADDRLVLSFKISEADFWRYQKWNQASLVFGRRPILYELQCQREFEGKGGIANWQVDLWRNGYPETRDAHPPQGLAQMVDQVNLAGIWAWVRGGGWGGPFVKNETWIDANVVAAPLLADNPRIEPRQLAQGWMAARLKGLDDRAAAAVLAALEQSPRFILSGFYVGPFARQRGTPWHPNGDWIQDDLVDAQAAWRMIDRLPEADLDEVVREKQQTVDQIASVRTTLQQAVTDQNHSLMDPLVNTLVYAESLFEALRDLLAGLVAYRRYQKSGNPALAVQCRQRLLAAQSHWNHHTQRHGSLPGCATAFREVHFWELTQKILGEVGA